MLDRYIAQLAEPIAYDGLLHVDPALRVTMPDNTYRVAVKLARTRQAFMGW